VDCNTPKFYIGHSTALGKSWVVKAINIANATGKVMSFCKVILTELEKQSSDQNINMDLSFQEVKEDVVEL